MKRNTLITIALFFLATASFAADEMRKLDWMIGEWKGDAWFQRGRGPRETIAQHERVTQKLGGKALLVEGQGRDKDGKLVHDAMGIIAWDPTKQQYTFRALTADAPQGIETALEPAGDNKWIWRMSPPNGAKIRYTITLTDKGQWNETGEYSRDGNEWAKFFEMTLTRVTPAPAP